MTGEHLGPKSAVNALEELFLEGKSARGGRAREGVTLVLVDEMDLLLTRKQKVGAQTFTVLRTVPPWVGPACRQHTLCICWPIPVVAPCKQSSSQHFAVNGANDRPCHVPTSDGLS